MTLAIALCLTSVLIKCTLCAIVDPNLYQYEAGPYIPDNGQISFPVSNPLLYQFTPNTVEQRNVRQLQPSPPRVPVDSSSITKNYNAEINEVIHALNELSESRADEHQDFRAAEPDNYGSSYPAGYDNALRPPNYGPLTPQNYGSHPQNEGHPSPKLSFLKPDLLVKPVASRAALKISSLIDLGLALLSGSTSGNLPLKGLLDVVINGIVKPLLTAKGGLKALISKLSIPMIALMLINVEVLVIMWWLWEEDCPEPVYHKPVYHPSEHSSETKPAYHQPEYVSTIKPVYQPTHYSPSYNYNGYR